MRFNWIVLIVIILCVLSITAFGQNNYWFENYTVIDSTVWALESVEQPGDSTCEHDWVSSGEYDPRPTIGCLVIHGCGETCDWHWPKKDLICKNCGRMEHWGSVVFSHCDKPRNEYQEMKELWYPTPKKEFGIPRSDSSFRFNDSLYSDSSFSIWNGVLTPSSFSLYKPDLMGRVADTFRVVDTFPDRIEELEARVNKLEKQVKTLKKNSKPKKVSNMISKRDTTYYIRFSHDDTSAVKFRIIYQGKPTFLFMGDRQKKGGCNTFVQRNKGWSQYKYSRDGSEMIF